MPRSRSILLSLTVATSLPVILVAHPQGPDRPRLSDVWIAGDPVTDLDGRPITVADLGRRLPSSALWVLRVQAAWCGTCRWHAAWTPSLTTRYGDRVSVIDLLFADEDNQPATVEVGRQWRDRTTDAAVTLVGTVVPDRLQAVFGVPAPLPRILLVDARTLSVSATLANPAPDRLLAAIDQVLDPARAAPPSASTLVDGLFSTDQWALIQGMRLPSGPPPDPTNQVADDPDAAAFGFHLFVDKLLSPAGVACSSCHHAEKLFTDGLPVPNDGSGHGRRNMPTVLLAGLARSQLWDGRADSLWSQAVMPFEDADEMASSRLFVAHAVRQRHWGSYEAIFGPLPDLDDRQRFPRHGRPGTADWDRMREADRDAVTRVFVNVGKAIAAFERSLRVAPGPLDRYATGQADALGPQEKDGLLAFLQAGCAQCHDGPRLSNDAFHNLRFPTGRIDREPDGGRIAGLPVLLASEFSRHGRYSDAPAPTRASIASDRAVGAFRTPTLRGVGATAPYGHGGTFASLTAVVEAHRTGGLPPDSPLAVGPAEPCAQGFDPALTPRIVRFLNALHANFR
jgi:cytochrome c peroxidase